MTRSFPCALLVLVAACDMSTFHEVQLPGSLGVVAGTVRDTAGHPLASFDVVAVATTQSSTSIDQTATNASGRYLIVLRGSEGTDHSEDLEVRAAPRPGVSYESKVVTGLVMSFTKYPGTPADTTYVDFVLRRLP